MRAERQQFLEAMARNDPAFPNMIYSAGGDRRADGARLNIVTVILNLDWPKGEKLHVLELASIPKTAVAATIFRVKDYLERRIMGPIRLLDVRTGCIRVRFALEDAVDPGVVRGALGSLYAERDLYSVVSLSGNVNGRAIKI